MAQAKGSSAQVVIDFETTYGTDPAAAAGIVMPFNTFGLRSDRNQIVPATITGTRNSVMPIDGNMDCKGPAVVPVDAIAFGYWLRALLGAPTTTHPDDYLHVFTVPTAIESMVVEAGFTDLVQYFKFNGVKLNSMSIDFGQDAELVANLDFLAADEALSGTVYDASPTELTFTRFTMKQLTIKEGGSTSSIIGTANITINNNLDGGSFVIGGGGIRGDLPEGVISVTGNIHAMFTAATLYNKAVNTTETSLEITATNGDNVLIIELPELLYKQNGIPIETPGGIWADLSFVGYYQDDADATTIKVSLTNTHTAYA